MAKHTPGPWVTCDSFGPSTNGTCVSAEDSFMVASCTAYYGRDGTIANARLIAAAPELLEALIWMVENDETNEGDEPVDELGGASWNEFNAYWIDGLNRAKAAIAKATGEQP